MPAQPTPRREFLRHAAFGLAVAPFAALLSCSSEPRRGESSLFRENGQGVLDLLPGLTAIILDSRGNAMSDGYLSPGRPDGMACFADSAGRWVLMRNHEISPKHIGTPDGLGAYELADVPTNAYSSTDLGGVSRLVLDPTTLEVIESNIVLSGTRNNCAGGPSPMGWFSCEETLDGDGRHGFVFLCDPDATALQPARRIDQYGRFLHEAAGFDPLTGICYLTEDRSDSCLYRFLPTHAESPFEGRLQAMRVIGSPRHETSAMAVGSSVTIDWIDVPDPLAGPEVAVQSQDLGAAVIVRGEGCWFSDQRLVFAATEGGPKGKGQIFELRDSPPSGELTVLGEATTSDTFSGPDNVVISPDGAIYFAEDNGSDCMIQRLTSDGSVEAIARNVERGEEIAGLCFSPDGSVLFANIQEPGITVAIRGL